MILLDSAVKARIDSIDRKVMKVLGPGFHESFEKQVTL